MDESATKVLAFTSSSMIMENALLYTHTYRLLIYAHFISFFNAVVIFAFLPAVFSLFVINLLACWFGDEG